MILRLITGSRAWTDTHSVEKLLATVSFEAIWMHGACPTGADAIADRWLRARERFVMPVPARWREEGKAAGPIRNQRMVDIAATLQASGWDVAVYAFVLPGSKGTQDTIRRARLSNLVVVETKLA